MDEKRTERVVVLLTEAERKQVEEQAGDVPLSTYLRKKALQDNVT